jgi:hypothetical protein
MLAGIIIAGFALRHLGGAFLMRGTLIITVFGDGLFLLLTSANLAWLALLCLGCVGLGRGLASIAWIGRIQELAPAHDTRFPLLHLGINGIAGMLAGLALMITVPWLEAQYVAEAITHEPLWLVVGAGVLLRCGSLVLALLPTRK